MNYGSICSGVEAATLAWEPLGWKAVFFAETEPFPAAVLQQRFGATRPLRPLLPEDAENEKDRKQRESWQKQIAELPEGGTIPNLGDFTKITKEDYNEPIDLLVGGTPCQSYSIAGLRKGLADPRGNLALEFVRLAYRAGVRWTVWENVPGVLSSGAGKDFASFLSLLCGWEIEVPEGGWRKSGVVIPAPGCFGLAWRILDAQYTRVPEFPRAIPQRRRRIFVVGYLGSWLYPATVLFDGEMRGGDTPPRRTKRQAVAACAEGSFDTTKSIRMRAGRPPGGKGALIGDDISHTLATGNDQAIVTLTEDAQWWDGGDLAGTLTGTSNNQLMPDKGRLQCVVEPDVDCIDTRQADVLKKELAPTLIATDYKGGKAVTENTVIGIGRDAYNQGQNAKYGISLSEDVQPTLTSRGPGAVCFENHPSDARLKEVPVSPTVMSRWGTGGNQVPLVMDAVDKDVAPTLMASMYGKNTFEDCDKYMIEGKPVAFIKNDAGGEQQGFWDESFPTLRSGALPAVAYNVTFCDANGTRKDRPDGGLYVTEADASKTVTAGGTNAETVVIDSVAIAENIIGRQDHTGGNGVGAQEELAYTQNATGVMGVATMECVPLDLRNATRDPNKKDEQNRQGVGVGEDGAPMNTITSASVPGVGWQSTVRKLLPVECERLMGFPDDHTRISWKGKPPEECPDAPRYKSCGNSMCVNVMAWIGHRIQAVEESIASRDAIPHEDVIITCDERVAERTEQLPL
jgi:site-specific DNA-cytosine methylase